jgi:hypothetical protein
MRRLDRAARQTIDPVDGDGDGEGASSATTDVP